MYESIIDNINNGNMSIAFEEVNEKIQQGCFDDILAVLAATIFIEQNDITKANEFITTGLKINRFNPELWLLLGNIYKQKNINQAYLCYENALYYASDENDKRVITQFIDASKAQAEFGVNNTSFVILSYNALDYLKQCIESIRRTCPDGSYEIIVVDNASTEPCVAWLKNQRDVKLLCNTENVGFPRGCNQGIELADKNNDIFLLNNDTILTHDSLFWLRMGLYEDEKVGATGSVSNSVSNAQKVSIECDSLEEGLKKGSEYNFPSLTPYEDRIYLVG